ncbi:MAG TPA: hypothetical protein VGO43_05845 [Pyrinomonadaceae bacterium]|jgi:hypothetical protein|nr:hypothetical protein [Pyrinomonadaceae bacterium]
MRKNIFLTTALVSFLAVGAVSQVRLEKCDPPSSWTQSTINPVRVLLKGEN